MESRAFHGRLSKEGKRMNKNTPALSAAMIIAAGAIWGTIGLFVRHLSSDGLDSMQVTTIRCAVTAIVLFLYLLIRDRSLLRVRLRDLWCFFGTGICSIVFFTWCYFSCITAGSLSVAAILLYTSPIFVTIMSALLFYEKITKMKIIALICAFGGCVLVSGVGEPITIPTLLYGLGAGFGYALYPIFGRFALRRYAPLTVIFYTFLFAAAGCLLISDLSPVAAYLAAGPAHLAFAAAFGIVSCVIPYLLYTAGLQHTEPGTAAVMSSIEPVVATLVGLIAYRESLSVPMVLGILLVLTAIVLLNRKAAARAA